MRPVSCAPADAQVEEGSGLFLLEWERGNGLALSLSAEQGSDPRLSSVFGSKGEESSSPWRYADSSPNRVDLSTLVCNVSAVV